MFSVAALLSRLTLFNHIEVCSNPQNVVLNYLAGAHPMYAASVLAGNDVISSMFGTIFPLFAGASYRNLGVGWATILLALLAGAFVPIPILLYQYGERIRMASKRVRHDFEWTREDAFPIRIAATLYFSSR